MKRTYENPQSIEKAKLKKRRESYHAKKKATRIKEIEDEMENIDYSMEMNNLMSGGENFGQNDSSYERLEELNEELDSLDPEYWNRKCAEEDAENQQIELPS